MNTLDELDDMPEKTEQSIEATPKKKELSGMQKAMVIWDWFFNHNLFGKKLVKAISDFVTIGYKIFDTFIISPIKEITKFFSDTIINLITLSVFLAAIFIHANSFYNVRELFNIEDTFTIFGKDYSSRYLFVLIALGLEGSALVIVRKKVHLAYSFFWGVFIMTIILSMSYLEFNKFKIANPNKIGWEYIARFIGGLIGFLAFELSIHLNKKKTEEKVYETIDKMPPERKQELELAIENSITQFKKVEPIAICDMFSLHHEDLNRYLLLRGTKKKEIAKKRKRTRKKTLGKLFKSETAKLNRKPKKKKEKSVTVEGEKQNKILIES